ncbi:MAG TPA: WHG domain-containing protein [Solirubrobacteraceae bacterium]|nr:WHG domain-containing protein [Solirubrobacteraceae bacterium]
MARVALDAERVVRAAAELADAEGPQRLTLAALAQRLGIRTPSLYAHVDGLADLRLRVAADALQELRRVLTAAVLGRAGADALRAAAGAYRAWALAHPGRYATIAYGACDPETTAAALGALDPVLAIMRGYGLEGEDAIHATRVVRSALHGFIALQAQGGFQMQADADETWERMITLLDRGLAAAAPAAARRGR